jgi:hypothetical protein
VAWGLVSTAPATAKVCIVKPKKYGALALCVVLLAGCGAPGTVSTTLPPVVYLAGFDVVGGSYLTATYWKDGIAVELTPENVGSRAWDIAVSGSDVYVAGVVSVGANSAATVWKNGVATALTDAARPGYNVGYAIGVTVSGTDVYVSGGEHGVDPSGNNYWIAEYWKNGVPVVLAENDQGVEASAIFVDGSNVYVAGGIELTTQTGPSSFNTEEVATYWKNGIPVSLTNGVYDAVADSIYVTGGDVYVGGFNCLAFLPDCNVAAYWKNGVPVQLPSSGPGEANSIVVAGGNVYVAGVYGAANGNVVAQTWINGIPSLLVTSPVAEASGISTYGGDFYVGGSDGSGSAGYWKNGRYTPVGNGIVPSQGLAITVVSAGQ